MATGVIQHFQLVYVNIVLFPMFQIIWENHANLV